jgi:hypothetical protein
MGHRLATALIFLNALGLLACVILIAANGNQTPDVAIHFTRAIQCSIRMFVVGVDFRSPPGKSLRLNLTGQMSKLGYLNPGQRIFC